MGLQVVMKLIASVFNVHFERDVWNNFLHGPHARSMGRAVRKFGMNLTDRILALAPLPTDAYALPSPPALVKERIRRGVSRGGAKEDNTLEYDRIIVFQCIIMYYHRIGNDPKSDRKWV